MTFQTKFKVGDAVWVHKAHNLGVIVEIHRTGKMLHYLIEWDTSLSKEDKARTYSERDITLVFR